MSECVLKIAIFMVFFLAIFRLTPEDSKESGNRVPWQKTWFGIDKIDSTGYKNDYYKKAGIYTRNESEEWHYVDTLEKNQTIDMYLQKILTLPNDPWEEERKKLEYQYLRIKYEY